MPLNNAVYMLVTKVPGCGKKEYRVARSEDISALTQNPTIPFETPVINCQAMMGIFGKSRVFTDSKIALGYAFVMQDRERKVYGVCKEDIMRLQYLSVYFPPMQ